jgi:arginine decarboxylase
MIGRTSKLMKRRLLIVSDRLTRAQSSGGRALLELGEELGSAGIEVVQSTTHADGEAAVVSDATLDCILIDWNLGEPEASGHEAVLALLRAIRRRNAKIPIFLLADQVTRNSVSVEVMQLADEFVWILEDTAPLIAGRVVAAIRRYIDQLVPPFTKALARYNEVREYSWAAPGHQGGVGFTRSPVGRMLFDFYGENLFRTDTGIERGALGSLLDHSGPVRESEEFAARIFGAHRSYHVVVGTSAANRTIAAAVVGENELALCDRNCHKSIEQSLILSGGIPVFFTPTRNRYGIIGPIPPQQLEAEAIRRKIEQHPLREQAASKDPVYAVVTNCTYDGLCYDAECVQDLLDRSVDRIHFDEAWYAYARFNPMYAGRHAMRGDPAQHPKQGPTVFATHSTHKLLAALSQSSYIHIRNGRNPIDHHRFNESYCMQTTTSPLYAIIASNEVGAAMMEGDAGQTLTQEVIDEAVRFRQALARCHREFAERRDWFFWPWNPPTVTDPKTGQEYSFEKAPHELLGREPRCWLLRPGEKWHGFEGLAEGYCMLDPIKPGIVCPGMGDDGELEPRGIPAAVVSAYLAAKGIVPSRTTDFMILPLFSLGTTKGKWATLINVLLDFKAAYDRNAPLVHELPSLVSAAPERYRGMGLRDLAEAIFAHMKKSRMDHWQARAFGELPKPEMPPRRAFQRLQAGHAELLPLRQMANRTVGVGVIPYPPGIPIVMPGENVGAENGPWLGYLRALQDWAQAFPGFEKEVEGSQLRDGEYHIWCLAEGGRRRKSR